MKIIDILSPVFTGKLELRGDPAVFLSILEEKGISLPLKSFHSENKKECRYHAEKQENGMVLEPENYMESIEAGVEKVFVILSRHKTGTNGFSLYFRGEFPKWAVISWTVSFGLTIVPLAFFTGIIMIFASFIDSVRTFAEATIMNVAFLYIAVPFIILGVTAPVFLVWNHKRKVKENLKRALENRAQAFGS